MIKLFNKLIHGSRYLNKQELLDLKDMVRMVNTERLRAEIIGGNTALVTQGQKYANILKSSYEVMQKAQQEMTMKVLYKLGFKTGQPVEINHTTGEVRPAKNHGNPNS